MPEVNLHHELRANLKNHNLCENSLSYPLWLLILIIESILHVLSEVDNRQSINDYTFFISMTSSVTNVNPNEVKETASGTADSPILI